MKKVQQDKCVVYKLTKGHKHLSLNLQWSVFLGNRQLLSYCLSRFMAHSGVLWPAILQNNLNQLSLSAWQPENETLLQQIPSNGAASSDSMYYSRMLTATLRHNSWRNKPLIIAGEKAFLLTFLSVWRMTFRGNGGGQNHPNKLSAAALVKCFLQWWQGSLIVSHTYTHLEEKQHYNRQLHSPPIWNNEANCWSLSVAWKIGVWDQDKK